MISLAPAVRNSRLAAIANALDAASAGATLRLYSAPRPSAGGALGGQILLVAFLLPKPCVASLDAGRLAFAPIADALCRHSGEAAWARLSDGDERWVMDLDVGLPGSEAEVALSAVQLFAGGVVSVGLAEMGE